MMLLPLLLAGWISLTRIRDFNHFPFQIICGSLIGIASALVAYRLNYVVNGWFLGPGDGMDHIPAHYHTVPHRENSHEMERVTVIPRHERQPTEQEADNH